MGAFGTWVPGSPRNPMARGFQGLSVTLDDVSTSEPVAWPRGRRHAYVTRGHSKRIDSLDGKGAEKGSIMTESGLAIFVLLAFAIPIPILAWLDSRPRRNAK